MLHEFVLTHSVLPSLGCGGESKSGVCLAKEKRAWLSPALGNLEELPSLLHYGETITKLKKRLGIKPRLIAHDLHPDYASSRYAKQRRGAELIGVQHHHAHIASCLAEYGINQPVIGICWDGSGWGTDGHIWGGEIMLAEYGGFNRFAYLAYVPLPGGEAAILEPYRMALSLLKYSFGEELIKLKLKVLNYIGQPRMDSLLKMMSRGVNCPLCSSMGRLFDAIASILRLKDKNSYQGEAAIALERLAHSASDSRSYAYDLVPENGTYVVDIANLIRAIVSDIGKNESPAIISRRFHNTLVSMALNICNMISDTYGIKQVVLGGGVFKNRLLVSLLLPALSNAGFRVFLPRRLSPDDSSIALGQVLVANAQFNPDNSV
jgi:hydrogenase maturation protein HypF